MFKAIVICSLVAIVSAGLLPDPHGYDAHAYEAHAPAHYDFSYSVHDGHTGDVKQQQESRRGDAVQGSYSLVEPDGHKRTVHYADDGHSGFNAVVEREGTVHHQPAIAHAAPLAVAHAAPLAVAHAAPIAVAHAAPLAVAHAAPLAHATSHQTFSAPIAHQTYAAPIAHQTYAAPIAHQAYAPAPQIIHAAAPSYQTIQPIQQLGYASHGYAGHGHASGYSTVSQVTHHGGYHH